MSADGAPAGTTAAARPGGVLPPVERICSDLIRFDTGNPGGNEREAAEYVAECLARTGVEPVVLEAAQGRGNVVARVPGDDPSAPALLIQGHLDTVPAEPELWSKHPHSGDISDGCVWGRGAVDMKNAVAMTLAALDRLLASGRRPRRDLVLAFVADEETGGREGAAFLVHEHRDLFEGCAVALGEVGGFNVPSADGTPTFAISVADKGLRWYEIRRTGVAGHGSMVARDNPIAGLAEIVRGLLSAPPVPAVLDPMRTLAESVSGRTLTGPDEVYEVLATSTGPFAPMLAAGARNTVNVTRVGGGYKENVIPSEAWARVDCRYVPGHEDALHEMIERSLSGRAAAELLRRSPAVVSDHAGTWFDHLAGSLTAVAPGCRVAPFVFSGGTDNKWFAELGVPTYGFTPMLLPDGFDFPAMFHGVDERFPVESLHFGVDVLEHLFAR
ncbi:M20/M25/M40 family metallo-hydrolase [Actinomadura roseirufa]|uniref:M20/M25/M40 family metallo-hydrolase n=1 Tax=Actinomadura roseirufa TaxID=2094049 RepID=UPI001041B59C|nr:M20/M25/M40 family metallo-hydrolase [Actinomadura roseirufa]